MFKYIPFTFKNLLRNKRRTTLTVLSMAVSLFLLGVLLSVYSAFFLKETTNDSALRLVTRHKVSLTHPLPLYYLDQIEKVDGVEVVSVQNWFGGTYIDNKPEHAFPRFAMDEQKVFKIYSEFKVPPEQLEAFLRDRQGFAVGKSIAEKNGFKLGQRITIAGDVYPITIELVVRAIFEADDDTSSFFHFKYFQESLPKGWDGFAALYAVKVKTAKDVTRVSHAIDDLFRNAPQPTKTETEAAFVLSFVALLGDVKTFLLSIAGAVVFTLLLVSANTVAMSARERVREMGVLKTLGFTTAMVLSMIVAEAVAMALIGGSIGIAFSYFLTHALKDVAVGFFSGFVMPMWGIPVCLFAAALLGFASAIVPASVAARTTITEALRNVG